jgi:hypothetical protein
MLDFDITPLAPPTPRAKVAIVRTGSRAFEPVLPTVPPVVLRPVPEELRTAPKVEFNPEIGRSLVNAPKTELDEIDRLICEKCQNLTDEDMEKAQKRWERDLAAGKVTLRLGSLGPVHQVYAIIGRFQKKTSDGVVQSLEKVVFQAANRTITEKVLLNWLWSRGPAYRKAFYLARKEGFAYRPIELGSEEDK